MEGVHETLQNHLKRIHKLESDVEELSKRLADLEEKERQRARADHAREELLDFMDAEGLNTSGC